MFRPLGSFVLLEEIKEENSQGGIVLLTDSLNPKCKVIAAGPDTAVEEGQTIMISRMYLVNKIEFDGEPYQIVKDENILLILED